MRKTETSAIAARESRHETSEFFPLLTALISIEREVLPAAQPGFEPRQKSFSYANRKSEIYK
jgi:hypothetical protein